MCVCVCVSVHVCRDWAASCVRRYVEGHACTCGCVWGGPNWAKTALYLEGLQESACNAGDLGLIPGLERSPEEGKGSDQISPQSCPTLCDPMNRSTPGLGLECSMDPIVHGVAKSQTGLSNFHFHYKASAPRAWRR